MSSTTSFIIRTRTPGDVGLLADGTVGILSDTKNLKKTCLAFMALAAGNVAVNQEPNGSTSVVIPVTAGQIVPFSCTRFFSTGTTITAAQIVLLYGPLPAPLAPLPTSPQETTMPIVGVGALWPFAKLSAGGSTWTPTSPGVPALWMNPRSNQMWQDTAGTVVASAPGDPVARIDVSNGTNLTQITSGRRPLLSNINGKPALLGDGTDDLLSNAQTIADAACTMVVVYKRPLAIGASTRQIIATMAVAGSKRFPVHIAGASASLPYLSWTLAGVSTAHVGVNTVVGDTALHVIVIKYLGGTVTDVANWRCWIDGVAQTVVTRAAITPSGITAVLARSDTASASDSEIGDFLVYDTAISDSDCASASSYFAAAWA